MRGESAEGVRETEQKRQGQEKNYLFQVFYAMHVW